MGQAPLLSTHVRDNGQLLGKSQHKLNNVFVPLELLSWLSCISLFDDVMKSRMNVQFHTLFHFCECGFWDKANADVQSRSSKAQFWIELWSLGPTSLIDLTLFSSYLYFHFDLTTWAFWQMSEQSYIYSVSKQPYPWIINFLQNLLIATNSKVWNCTPLHLNLR